MIERGGRGPFRRRQRIGALLRLRFSVLALFSLVLGARAERAEFASHEVRCGVNEFRYVLLVPGNTAEATPMPAVLLLHGAGDSPEPMVEAWRKIAAAERIVLIAPALPREERFESMAPAVFECVVEDAKKAAAIDPARVYIFGNSMGGYLTYDAAMLRSEYFAAAAVHAMQISPEYDWIVTKARRKMPIAIYIGDRDPLVPVEGVRRTRDLLIRNGFTVHYKELQGHDHNYYAVNESVNRDAWEFLRGNRAAGTGSGDRSERNGSSGLMKSKLGVAASR